MTIVPATESDLPLSLELIRALAGYERLSHLVNRPGTIGEGSLNRCGTALRPDRVASAQFESAFNRVLPEARRGTHGRVDQIPSDCRSARTDHGCSGFGPRVIDASDVNVGGGSSGAERIPVDQAALHSIQSGSSARSGNRSVVVGAHSPHLRRARLRIDGDALTRLATIWPFENGMARFKLPDPAAIEPWRGPRAIGALG